jgi:hypothetical protein
VDHVRDGIWMSSKRKESSGEYAANTLSPAATIAV